MFTKHIDIHHHFLKDMLEDKDMNVTYIVLKENPADILMRNYPKADYVKHMKRILEGGIWELMEPVRDNFNNNRVQDGVTDCDLTEYFSQTLADDVDKENINGWILDTRYRHGK